MAEVCLTRLEMVEKEIELLQVRVEILCIQVNETIQRHEELRRKLNTVKLTLFL